MKNNNMVEDKKSSLNRFLPFILTICIVLFDQITKALVIKNIPVGTIAKKYFGDFLWICHVRNTGAAFSMGADSSAFIRIVVLIVLPLVLMGFIAWAIASKRSMFNSVQKWFAAGILGGGLGTICDRIFRFDEGVVDFISVKFYGLFGLERWPTFNVSDSCVVIFVILFALSVIFCKSSAQDSGKKKENSKK